MPGDPARRDAPPGWRIRKAVRLGASRIPIVATVGPAVFDTADRIDRLEELLDAGAAVFRINLSHVTRDGDREAGADGKARTLRYSYAEVERIIARLRELEERRRTPLPVMLDLKGPEIRILGISRRGETMTELPVEEGDRVLLRQEAVGEAAAEAPEPVLTLGFEGDLRRELEPGGLLRVDDGRVEMEVLEVGDLVTARVATRARIRLGKSINLPGRQLSVPSVTERDRADLAAGFDADLVAQSFVRSVDDVRGLAALLERHYGEGLAPKIVAKIETAEAVFVGVRDGRRVDEFLAILEDERVFGAMVARGDLGGQLGIAKVPALQQRLIDRANRVGKPVIVATQMLESMRGEPVPTRAEAQDICTAVAQGADALMLSAETASGLFPVRAVETMRAIIEEADFDHDDYRRRFGTDFVYGGLRGEETLPEHAVDVIGHAVVTMAEGSRSPFILTYATSGWSAARISRFRPRLPTRTLAITGDARTARVLRLLYGVGPVLLAPEGAEERTLPRGRQEVLDLLRFVIREIVRDAPAEAVARLGPDWEERFVVATLAHERPTARWDIERVLLVFKP